MQTSKSGWMVSSSNLIELMNLQTVRWLPFTSNLLGLGFDLLNHTGGGEQDDQGEVMNSEEFLKALRKHGQKRTQFYLQLMWILFDGAKFTRHTTKVCSFYHSVFWFPHWLIDRNWSLKLLSSSDAMDWSLSLFIYVVHYGLGKEWSWRCANHPSRRFIVAILFNSTE